jgi:fluoroacetyl-CoA thioesterase
MIEDLSPGIGLTLLAVVSETDTAKAYGSGLLEVYATPAMISFMEHTAMDLVQEYLPKGYGTVGTKICVEHLKASPVGAKIKCESKLIEVQNRKLIFELRVTENEETIGSGTHERFIIEEERFLKKLR